MGTKSRRSGGPRSAIGKAKSVQNSLKHGLTTTVPSSELEKTLMASFITELTDFYQPQSPLEKLQIERIAMARVKLTRLYETEQARIDLEINKLTRSPDQFFEKMPHVKGIAKGIAMEFIQFGELTLPFALTELQLAQIASEIRGIDGKQLDEVSLWKVAPQLASFVDRQNTDDSPLPRLLRLEAILQSIENTIDQGERYMERVKSIYSAYQHLLILKGDELEDDETPEEESELAQLIREQQAYSEAERTKRHPKSKMVATTEHEEQQTQKRFLRILKQCHVLVSLYFYYQEAKRIYMQFMETRNLMLKAVTLPASEAELFLRYQTTLERRLSSAIGELLELQRRR